MFFLEHQRVILLTKRIRLNFLLKLSDLKLDSTLTLGYLKPSFEQPSPGHKVSKTTKLFVTLVLLRNVGVTSGVSYIPRNFTCQIQWRRPNVSSDQKAFRKFIGNFDQWSRWKREKLFSIQTKNFIRTLTEVDDGSNEILDKHIVVRLRHIPS